MIARHFIIFLISAIYSHTVLSQNTPSTCEDSKLQFRLAKYNMISSCENLRSCLIIRDTCLVEDTPNNEEKCTHLNQCTRSRATEFPGETTCQYEWRNTPDRVELQCELLQISIAGQNACPGNILFSDNVLFPPNRRFPDTERVKPPRKISDRFKCKMLNDLTVSHFGDVSYLYDQIAIFCRGENVIRDRAEYTIPSCLEMNNFNEAETGFYALPPKGIPHREINETVNEMKSTPNSGSGEIGIRTMRPR